MEKFLVIPPQEEEANVKTFYHIYRTKNRHRAGYQVRTGTAPSTYYGADAEGNLGMALFEAIRDRNQRYESLGYPDRLLYKPELESVPDPDWASGYRQVHLVDGKLVRIAVWDLPTGKRTTLKWEVKSFRSRAEACTHAQQVYNNRTARYNRIIVLANRLLVDLRLRPAAQLELITARPWLQYQKDSDRRIYREAYHRLSVMMEDLNARWKHAGKVFTV